MRADDLPAALSAYLASLRRPGPPRDRVRSLAKLGRLALYSTFPRWRHRLFLDRHLAPPVLR